MTAEFTVLGKMQFDNLVTEVNIHFSQSNS